MALRYEYVFVTGNSREKKLIFRGNHRYGGNRGEKINNQLEIETNQPD